MQPPRNFPVGNLKLVEMDGSKVVKTHIELPINNGNRIRIQNMRLDMLMVNPKLNLLVVENSSL